MYSKMIIRLISILHLILFMLNVKAQDQVIQLYDGKAPGSEKWTWKEAEMYSDLFKTELVYNVTNPSMLLFKPKTPVSQTAIIIAPGGGFQSLSINREGVALAKELNKMGVTAFVLKYRLLESKTNDPAKEMMANLGDRDEFDRKTAPIKKLAGEDIRTAVAYLRDHADEYGIASDKIGVIGFSAGATVVLESVLNSSEDRTRPDFAASIYGGPSVELLQAALPTKALPLFICAASDDQLKLAPKSIQLYHKWLAADFPVEMHIYSRGGHGFGMGTQNLPVDTWYLRYNDWLQQYHFLDQ